MKYLKTYNKLFESGDFTIFEDLFRELKDQGFKVTVGESNTRKLDFSKSDVIDIHTLISDFEFPIQSIRTIDVKVERRVNAQDNTRFFGPTRKEFNIDEIKENLKFAESYAKDELGLEIEFIFVSRVPKYLYYKSVDALPDNKEVDSVTFFFKK
jgi:hypothetical protein